jgi:hypothetical protein
LFEIVLDYEPAILNGLDELSLMSAANAISIDFKAHAEERLIWIEQIVSLAKLEVDPLSADTDISRDVMPDIGLVSLGYLSNDLMSPSKISVQGNGKALSLVRLRSRNIMQRAN